MKFPEPTSKKTRGMVRDTFHHAAVYSGANLLGRLIGFIMLPFYAHILRDVGYGVIGMIDAALVFLSSLMAYELQGAILRIYHGEPDPARKPRVATTGVAVTAAITLALSLLAIILSKPISNLLLGTVDHWLLICLAMATFCVDMIGQTAQTILVIQRRSVTYSLISLMRLILGVSLNIVLVVILRWDLLGFFLSGLIVAAVTLVVSLLLLVRSCGANYDTEIAQRLLKFQLPLVPGSIANFISRQVERIVVRYKIDLATVGILEMAYKFPVLINLLVTIPFMRSWATHRLEIADEPGAPERIGKMFSYHLYLTMAAGLFLAVNIRTILEIMTPPEFWVAYRFARIEIMQVIVLCIGQHLNFGLFYASRTEIYSRLNMIVSAFKVGLSYVMISIWGLYGAAWSGFIAAVVFVYAGHLLARRHYHIILPWPQLGIIVGMAVVLFLAIDSVPTESIATWGAPILVRVDSLLSGLQDTWMGRWKDGKVLLLLDERGALILDLFIRTLLVSVYLLVIPIARAETRRKVISGRSPGR